MVAESATGLVPWSRAELRYLARRTRSSASPLASTRVCMRVGASQVRRGSGPPGQFRQARARSGTSAHRTPPPGALRSSEGGDDTSRGRNQHATPREGVFVSGLLQYAVAPSTAAGVRPTPPSGCGCFRWEIEACQTFSWSRWSGISVRSSVLYSTERPLWNGVPARL